MAAEFIWTAPSEGDGRRARRDEWNRGDWHFGLPTSPSWVHDARRDTFDPFDHLEAIILAAEHSGFDALLLPYDLKGEESWIVSAVAARLTRWVRTLVEFAPSITTPVYAAKLTATLQRISAGRLDWKIVVDQDHSVAAAQGDQLRGIDRYSRADEFLTIAKSVWREHNFDFDGRYYAVDSGGLDTPLNEHPFPRIFLEGTSPDAFELGAKYSDVHILSALDDTRLSKDIDVFTALAAARDRSPKLGALSIIAREDSDEAWARVNRLLDERGIDTVDSRQFDNAHWSRFAEIGYASPAGLIGSYEQVQVALDEYRDRGIGVFIVNGYPNVEEVYRVGQHVLSRFAAPAFTS